MISEEKFNSDLNAFIEEFLNSDVYAELKKADAFLYEDKELRPYIKKKEELESELKVAYSRQDGSEKELMASYRQLLSQIAEVPSVKQYDKAYDDVKEIKAVFDKMLLEVLA
jgi:hypothetical protein